jgi:Cytochrome c/c1 heme lyase
MMDNSTTSRTSSEEVASLEEAAKYAQTPQPDQRFPLRTDRQVSSIPRGSTNCINNMSEDSPPVQQQQLPHHQATIHAAAAADDGAYNATTLHKKNHWIYPSEQQLYNAMRRKGWQNVPVDSIPTVLQIHNSINERTWDKVLEWEYLMMTSNGNGRNGVAVPGRNYLRHRLGGLVSSENEDEDDSLNHDPSFSSIHDSSSSLPPSPRLVRFEGRPKDMTPKAYLLSKILRLYDPPFDRHDWYVESYHGNSSSNNSDDNNSTTANTIVQRYVIDYYMKKEQQHGDKNALSIPIPYVDARPAVDSPRAVWMRTRRFLQDVLQDAFPGIAAYYSRRYCHQQSRLLKQQQQQQQQVKQQQQPKRAQPK